MMRTMRIARAPVYALALVLAAGAAAALEAPQLPAGDSDLDRDGLADDLEAFLLEHFRPTFMVSAGDCDLLPSEFLPGLDEPQTHDRNGTTYGQVFRRGKHRDGSELVEIHYYHLWSRDCGRMSHPLDAEHVSVLVIGNSLPAAKTPWRARYWYAAAHEDTVCDTSRWADASALGAEESGPVVWISAGKHASYLHRELCGAGCGQDVCQQMFPLSQRPIINIGELGAPLNGALWTSSRRWPLAEKMTSDFPDAVTGDSFDAASLRGSPSRSSAQAIIAGGGSSLNALAFADQSAEDALASAGASAGRGVNISVRETGNALKRAASATARILRLRAPSAPQPKQ